MSGHTLQFISYEDKVDPSKLLPRLQEDSGESPERIFSRTRSEAVNIASRPNRSLRFKSSEDRCNLSLHQWIVRGA